jgi:hypothetical protein
MLLCPVDAGPCISPGCIFRKCPANRVIWDAAAQAYFLQVVHEKTDRFFTVRPVRFRLPAALCEILEVHVRWGRNAILNECGAADRGFLFIDPARGGVAYTETSKFTRDWEAFMLRIGAGGTCYRA